MNLICFHRRGANLQNKHYQEDSIKLLGGLLIWHWLYKIINGLIDFRLTFLEMDYKHIRCWLIHFCSVIILFHLHPKPPLRCVFWASKMQRPDELKKYHRDTRERKEKMSRPYSIKHADNANSFCGTFRLSSKSLPANKIVYLSVATESLEY